MNSEQAALDFVVGLTSKGVEASVNKLVTAFNTVAAAAEFANRAISGDTPAGGGTPGGGGGTDPGGVAKRHKKKVEEHVKATNLLGDAMKAMGDKALRMGWGLAVQGARVSLEAYKDHTLALIQFRKTMGSNSEEMARFSGQILNVTSQFGTALDTTRHLAFTLSQGLIRTTGDAANLAGQLGQLDTRSGMASDTTSKFIYNLQTSNKVFADDSAALHHLRVIKEMASHYHSSADALTRFVGGNKEIYGQWSSNKEVQKSIANNLTVIGSAYGALGLNVDEIGGLFNELGRSQSQLGGLFRANSKDLKSFILWLTAQGERMDMDSGSRAEFAQEFGEQSITVFNNLIKATKDWSKYETDFTKTLAMTDAELERREANKMSTYEQIGENLRSAAAGAASLWANLDKGLGVTKWFVDATSALKIAIEEVNKLLHVFDAAPSGGLADTTKAAAKSSYLSRMDPLQGRSGTMGFMETMRWLGGAYDFYSGQAKSLTGVNMGSFHTASTAADEASRAQADDYKRQLTALKAQGDAVRASQAGTGGASGSFISSMPSVPSIPGGSSDMSGAVHGVREAVEDLGTKLDNIHAEQKKPGPTGQKSLGEMRSVSQILQAKELTR